jgi:hypothetical protein
MHLYPPRCLSPIVNENMEIGWAIVDYGRRQATATMRMYAGACVSGGYAPIRNETTVSGNKIGDMEACCF